MVVVEGLQRMMVGEDGCGGLWALVDNALAKTRPSIATVIC